MSMRSPHISLSLNQTSSCRRIAVMSFLGGAVAHNQHNFVRRRTSVCQSGSPLRAAMDLRGFREAGIIPSSDAQSSSVSFPVLTNYEQIVGCIMESLRSGHVTIDDFDRGADAVRAHLHASSRRSTGTEAFRGGESSSTPTGATASCTPIQRRDRAYSLSTKPIPLSLEDDDCVLRCERKWSMDTVSTTLPQSCTNERRLRVLTSLPGCSPTLGYSPAPNIPLPPASPSTVTLPRSRGFSACAQDIPTPSPLQTPLFTPLIGPINPPTTSFSPSLALNDITLGDVVGSGSFGVVYRARVNSTGQLIVVKVVSIESHDKQSIAHVDALENELQLLLSLRHPRIVRYLGHERFTGRLDGVAISPNDGAEKLLVMCEYMPGGSIASAIRQFGAFEEKAIALHTRQILEGLGFLHENRVCHRDLKCDNVLIDVNGSCKLADFGCSKRLDISPEGATVIMKSMKGSIPWMAPEVLMGQGYGRSSDVWALGCVVLEMALGRNPWGHFDNIMQAMYRIGMGTKGPEIPDTLSENCRNFVNRCLCRDARSRPSVSDLLEDPFVRLV